jgi:hypothetical protein
MSSISLARLLGYDSELFRPRPPVTLPSLHVRPPPPASSPPPETAPPHPPLAAPEARRRARNGRAELPQGKVAIQDRDDAKDGQEGPWSREELVRMNQRFTVAVRGALAAGEESPAAASASCDSRQR